MRFIFFICLALASCSPLRAQEYTNQRNALIAKAIDSPPLSDDEKKVDTYLQALMAKEFKTSSFLPSRNFLECQKEIENSLLYSFLRRMPKGSILHAHAMAIGDFVSERLKTGHQ